MPQLFRFLDVEGAGSNVVYSDDARIIAAVSSYPGEDIPLEYWALRTCIPFTVQ